MTEERLDSTRENTGTIDTRQLSYWRWLVRTQNPEWNVVRTTSDDDWPHWITCVVRQLGASPRLSADARSEEVPSALMAPIRRQIRGMLDRLGWTPTWNEGLIFLRTTLCVDDLWVIVPATHRGKSVYLTAQVRLCDHGQQVVRRATLHSHPLGSGLITHARRRMNAGFFPIGCLDIGV